MAEQNILEQIDAARVQFDNSNDALVFLVHSLLVSHGFHCVGIDDDSPADPRFSASLVPSPTWNAKKDIYSFRYDTSEGTSLFVKFVPIGEIVLLHAVVPGHPSIFTVELQSALSVAFSCLQ